MDYSNMMKDYVAYINRHSDEDLTAEQLGRIHSLKGEYISYLFSCYYQEFLDSYISKIKRSADKNKEAAPVFPKKRYLPAGRIKTEYNHVDSFMIAVAPVVKNENDVYHPIEAAVKKYANDYEEDETSIVLWWHDEEYSSYYMQGRIYKDADEIEEGFEVIKIPSGKYVTFSFGKGNSGKSLEEELKCLYHYAHSKWVPKYEREVDTQGYSFQCLKDGKAYYFLALLDKEKEDPDKTYGVDTWTHYIDNNIFANLTTASLAKQFGYSPTHFKRIFRTYYEMSVADYIRKRRLTMSAEEIREGADYFEVAQKYGFSTYPGFARAFRKEFNMSPAVYSQGVFEVIDLAKYYDEYKDSLRLAIVDLKSIHMIGHTVIPSKGAEVDIPAQVSYWIGREFPCLKNTRFECNVSRREDKIALWYQDVDTGDYEYILGPVVESFDEDIPTEMAKVTLQSGKYAIFETEKRSDEESVAETLRMYTRCVFFGWVKEYRNRVDLTRVTFERYVNGKIYLYVPVNY